MKQTKKSAQKNPLLLTGISNQLEKHETFDEDRWYLVTTIPGTASDQEILRHIRSEVPAVFFEKELHHKVSNQMKEIHKSLFEFTRSHKKKGEAVCTVTSFSEKELSRSSLSKVDEVLDHEAIAIPQSKKITITLSHVPDFSHVLAQIDSAEHSRAKLDLTITLTPSLATVYAGSKIDPDTKVGERENIFVQPEHNRYYEKYSVERGQSVRHGTGNEKFVRTLESGLLLFVRNTLAFVDDAYKSDNVSLFFSQGFKHLHTAIEKMVDSELHASEIEVGFSSSDLFDTVSSESDLEEKADLKSSDANDLDSDPSSSQVSVTDLHQVTKALRQGRVAKLYLSPDLDRHGYVTEDGTCYTYPVKGSKKV